MRSEDRDFLKRRADDELRLAQQAKDPCAGKVHYELLGLYLSRLYPPDGLSASPDDQR
jgi:hypothetical protein